MAFILRKKGRNHPYDIPIQETAPIFFSLKKTIQRLTQETDGCLCIGIFAEKNHFQNTISILNVLEMIA
jgi:hypothetical protein